MKLSAAIFLSTLVGCNGWSTTSNSQFAQSSRVNFSSLKSTLNDLNVVLRPSEDPNAFDNSKIGAARVHRYARDAGDSEAEYIMWYHGRNEGFDEEGELPPLSTGRIGRATSINGLHWVREEKGSASEDMTGVSLGLNKESWWGFDTSHVGLGQVLLPMSTPAVMTDVSYNIVFEISLAGHILFSSLKCMNMCKDFCAKLNYSSYNRVVYILCTIWAGVSRNPTWCNISIKK
jgi:hypothetical protein